MFIPGFKSIDEFAAFSGFNVTTVYRQLKRGCCRWPKKVVDGSSAHPLYHTWTDMIYRCTSVHNPDYKYYGARGITVCIDWRVNFWQFVKDMGEKPFPRATLDRIDNDKGYSKDNCQWAGIRHQRRNTRQFRGNIRQGNQKTEGYIARIKVLGKEVCAPTTPDYEQAEIYLEQLELLYKDYL